MWSIAIQGLFLLIAAILDKKMEWLCIIPIVYKGIFLDIAKTITFHISIPSVIGTVITTFTISHFISATKNLAEKWLEPT